MCLVVLLSQVWAEHKWPSCSECRSSYMTPSSALAWSGPMRHCDPLSTSQGVTFMARGGAFICPCVSVCVRPIWLLCRRADSQRVRSPEIVSLDASLSLLLPPTPWLLSLGALCSSQFFAPYCQRLWDLLTTTRYRRHIRSCIHWTEQALNMNKQNCIGKCRVSCRK